MSYWYDDTTPTNGTSRRCVNFVADETSDVSSLPTSTTEGTPQGNDSTLHLKVSKGSSCFVLSPASLYMLNSNDEWVEL